MSWSKKFRGAGVVAFGSAAVMLGTMPSHADDGIFESWSTVGEDVLEVQRGRNIVVDETGISIDQAGAAVAVNIGIQYVENTINGDAPAGAMTLMQNALSDQRMVINAFNTAPNVTFLNQLSIAVDMTTPPTN